MKSCDECKYYHAEYGGVCFAQKDAPKVFWQAAETCDDFTYKDAKLPLDPISLSKGQVHDIYEFLDGKDNPTGEALYKNICKDISRGITERLTAEAERLIFAADRDRRIGFKNIRLEHFVRTCKKCGKKFITLYRVATVCQKCQEEAERLIFAADRDRRINELQEKMLKGEVSQEELDEYLKLAKEAELDIHKPLVRTCEKCGKNFITRYRVARICQKCQEEN